MDGEGASAEWLSRRRLGPAGHRTWSRRSLSAAACAPRPQGVRPGQGLSRASHRGSNVRRMSLHQSEQGGSAGQEQGEAIVANCRCIKLAEHLQHLKGIRGI